MYSLRYVQLQAKKNSYFLLFFFIGLFLNLNFSYIDVCEKIILNRTVISTPIKINPIVTLSQTQNGGKKLIRPRYYSTELGIREKLFVGVLTSIDQIDHRAIAINRTVAHLTDKIKFFMTASQKYKTTHNLGNIVGFTDTRESLRPFHIIKYISDSFGQGYDYFFLMKDSSYLDAHLLKFIVNKISVSQDVYLGTKAHEGSFCLLDSGILFSNSVVTAMRANLEWCVRNAFSDNHSDNLGRCIARSIRLECQEEIQGQTLPSYRLKHYNVIDRLGGLLNKPVFTNAAVVYPISSPEDLYTLHAIRSREGAAKTQNEVKRFEKLVKNLTPELPEEYKKQSWPTGHRSGNKPITRWDVPRHSYFNLSHKFFSDDYTNLRKLTIPEKQDIENVIEAVVAKVQRESNDRLFYRRLVNGYSLFDLSRGLDYVLDVGFRDSTSGREIIKRFEVCKPLGQTEILPMPYVTENTRISLILVVKNYEVNQARNFLEHWSKNLHNQRLLIMLVFLYTADAPSKGEGDPFITLKNLAVTLTDRNKRPDGSRAAWLSIRLPENIIDVDDTLLRIASVDLGLRKIGPDALVLLLDVHTEITSDFLNRVRMNTIAGVQIFNPIPFRRYHPAVGNSAHIHKNTGRFDNKNYDYISFYGKDWIGSRLEGEKNLPIVRTDRDINRFLEQDSTTWDVFKVFVKNSPQIHTMRAPESGLTIKHHGKSTAWLGSKTQLANLILSYSQTKIS